MALRKVLKMGDARLLVRAQAVKRVNTPELDTLVRDMRDTMVEHNGVGLAATQLGVGLRVAIFGARDNPRYPDAGEVPETVLINLGIEVLDEVLEYGWEGCLSLPGLRGLVPRFRRIRYRGLDEHGNRIEREAEGFHARVVQHECDHLDGILYPMRMDDMSRFGFEDAMEL